MSFWRRPLVSAQIVSAQEKWLRVRHEIQTPILGTAKKFRQGAITAATQSIFGSVAAELLYGMFQTAWAVDWVVEVIAEAVTTLESMFVKDSA